MDSSSAGGPFLFFATAAAAFSAHKLQRTLLPKTVPAAMTRVSSKASLTLNGGLKRVKSELSLTPAAYPQNTQPKPWDRLISKLPSKSSTQVAWLARIFMIWPIKAALPLSIARAVIAYKHEPKLRSKALDALLAAECLFFLHFRIKLHLLSKKPARAVHYKYPGRDRQEFSSKAEEFGHLLDHFKHALPTGLTPDALQAMKKQEIANWFTLGHGNARRVPAFEQIHRHHASQWIAWAFWDCKWKPHMQPEIDPLVDLLELRIGSSFLNTDNYQDIRPLCLNLDPPRAVHHPILHYVVTHMFATLAAKALFRWRGFRFGTLNGQDYYHKKCQETDRSKCLKPLIFISGIGIGLISYEKLIEALTTDNRDVLLFDLPEISLRWTFGLEHKHVPPLQTVDTITELVRACVKGDQGAHAVAHSFGTVVTQWLIRLNADPIPLISSTTLIDPVCFLLISSSVAANFCYRAPVTFLDHLVSYFVAREIGVDNALHRHFQWRSNNFDPRLLPKDCAVVLSELDAFVPSASVHRHLNSERPDCLVEVLEGHFHSQFQVVPSSFLKVSNLSKRVDRTYN